jgi:hypothetical protein
MVVLILLLYAGLAIALGLAIVFVAFRSYFSARLGIGLILWLFLLESVVVYFPGVLLGVRIYPQDLVFMVLATAAGLRWMVRWKVDAAHAAWLAFGAVLFALFFAGLALYGTTAGVEFRTYFYFWVAVAYTLSFAYNAEDSDWIARQILVVSAALGALVVYRWTADAFGWSAVRWEWIGARVRFRVVAANQAHFLVSALLIMLVLWGRDRLAFGWRIWLPLLAVMLVILQHRSVWIVMLATVALVFLLEPQGRRTFGWPGFVFLLSLICLAIGLAKYGHLESTLGSLHASIHEATQGKGSTFNWRLQSWDALLRDWVSSGPVVNAFGKPFGTGYLRYVEDLQAQTNYSPHSYYVQTLLRGGLVGLAALLMAYLLALRAAFSRREADVVGLGTARAMGFVLIGQLVYSSVYTPHFVQGIFLGVLLSLAATATSSTGRASVRRADVGSQLPG